MAEAKDTSSWAGESSSSSSAANSNEAGEFECNICLELAQDPVITLCGHLYCWPCLCRWLRAHSQSHECPVCKALVQEEKVIPLYGRGKAPTDPRTKPVPGAEIPTRPRGMRPEAVQNQEEGNFGNLFMGLMGGFMPMASATFSNFGMSAGFGGLFTPFFSVQFIGFSGSGTYDGSTGLHHGYPGSYRGAAPNGQMNRGRAQVAQAADENLKKILFVVLFFVLVAFLTM